MTQADGTPPNPGPARAFARQVWREKVDKAAYEAVSLPDGLAATSLLIDGEWRDGSWRYVLPAHWIDAGRGDVVRLDSVQGWHPDPAAGMATYQALLDNPPE